MVVSVLDQNGTPVEGLGPRDFVVREDGAVREVLRVEPAPNGRQIALLVDELIGLQQVVIKGLNEDLRNDPCLSGCAILGDGRIGLILDANGLVEHSKNATNVAYQ